MNLKPEERYGTPEAQTASLVIPKPDVAWVILQTGGGNQLYSCKRPQGEAERASSPPPSAPSEATARPAAAPIAAVPVPTSASSAPNPAPATAVPAAAPVAVAPPPAAPTAASEPKGGPAARVTNNPEAVRGCRFLASFTEYQTVSRLQDAVARSGGDVAYIVASNRDGEVIGESYRCAAP
jgi:hypothetical protein